VLSNVVAVVAGNAHSVALDASGRVWAWGANNFAQVGNGTASGNSLLPAQVKDTAGSGFLTGITAIARGKNHTLARKADGGAWIWGDRGIGNTPAPVGGLSNITAVAGGIDFDLALTGASLSVSGPSGTPPTILSGTNVTATWTNAVSPSASNTIGLFPLPAPSSAPRAQIGTTGGASDSQVFPIPLTIQPGTYELRLLSPSGVPLARSTRFLVVASPVSGRPWTAGASSFGQLGDNCAAGSTCADRAVPDLMYRLADVTAIAASASGNHSLALDSIGRVWAWGSNSSGQLGSACAVGLSCSVASQVGGLVGPFVAVAAGGQLNASPARSHSLALHADHTLWAWGANNLGQLGNGCALPCADSPTPMQVKDPTGMGVLTNIVAIAAGRAHSLALRGDGAVFAWGANGDGQLGNHASSDSSLPVQVWAGSGGCCLSGATAIAAGSEHSMAVVGSGVRAWGANFDGQLGSGATGGGSDTPLAVGSLGGVTTVAAGNNFSLALAAGGVYGWGFNSSGQLGNACTLMLDCTDVPTPTRVRGPGGVGFLDSVDAIAAGQFFSLAVRHDGTGWAWGANGSGQLGDGTTIGRTAPVQVYGLTGLTAAAGGSAHTVLLTSASAPASPTPTATPTRTPTASPTATSTATPSPTATHTAVASATPSATPSPTPPNAAPPSVTPTSPPAPPCTPRPSIGVQTTPNGDGRLRVVLTASSNASTPTNVVQAVQITRLTNASVQIGTQSGVTGSYAVVPPAPSLTLLVSRPSAGASTVELTVTDACGAWPTLVGGGPSAF
jgi:alpha-tubulin suppressor-like RCC1 family protein